MLSKIKIAKGIKALGKILKKRTDKIRKWIENKHIKY